MVSKTRDTITLQRCQFPDSAICSINEMFFRTNLQCVVIPFENVCKFKLGGLLTTDTYFNSFSIGKWDKYTFVRNIRAYIEYSGKFRVSVHHARIINNQTETFKIEEKVVSSDKREIAYIDINSHYDRGILYLEVEALEDDCRFYDAGYECVDDLELSDVNIAVGICTFRREDFIKKNVKLFEERIFADPSCPMKDSLQVFISDNGHTLGDLEHSDRIHLFENKNTGGAGGFTRAMIEVLDANKNGAGFTHILMMDDDVLVSPDAFVRTYTFLRCIRPDYKKAFIGGHMLDRFKKNIQTEAADHFDSITHHPVKHKFDLLELSKILNNEIEDPVNYLSWWYCCMPIDIVTESNLPLPLFIKRDDIEYGLRNGKTFITLNGICVWHEPFDYKSSPHLTYYYYRNLCILLALRRKKVTEKAILKEIKQYVLNAIYTFRYRDAEFCLLGIKDFLKGFDYIKSLDAEKLNAELMKLNYVKSPIEELDWKFQYDKFIKSYKYSDNGKKSVIRKLPLNGWLFPAKRNVIVQTYKPKPGQFFRARKALNYEDSSQTGFITYKSYKAMVVILREYYRVKKDFHRKYSSIKDEYIKRQGELTNIDFWNEYLGRDGEEPDVRFLLRYNAMEKSTKKEIVKKVKCDLLRGLQYILPIPVKKNLVMFLVHSRKGFTCNPKYVMEELLKRYGEKVDVYWVTRYPESCKDAPKGVKVIKNNSFKHKLNYMRCRVYVTNDCFPAWAARFKRHIWINTWHGAINYKHIGYDYLDVYSPVEMKWFKLRNRQPDYFLSASSSFTETTSEGFYLDKSCFLECGLPRNDIFFKKDDELAAKIKKRIGVDPEFRIVLYAPTFRQGINKSTFELDLEKVIQALSERFGGSWVFLIRFHNFIKKNSVDEDVINVSDYPDMNELMYVSDVLISDYSSAMYDFCLQYKPCFVYATDVEYYGKRDRGFAVPMSEWPYPIASTNEELVDNIHKFDMEDFSNKLKLHFEKSGSKDDGNASARVVDVIEKYISI